ncbi:MAG: T9SS type A sorting domain-containing protein, partial [Bacteroidota bacterium]
GGYDLWTWEAGTNWVQKSSGTLTYTDPQFVYYYHHSYVFQNSSVLYIAADGGIHKSYDGGSNFITLNKNYKTAQFFSIAEHANGNVIGGTQGNGTLLFDSLGNTPQTAKLLLGNYETAGSSYYFGTDGGYCSYSLLNPEVVIASGAKHKFARSIDNGITFTSPGDILGSKLYNSTYSYGSYLTPACLWESFNDTYSPDTAMFAYMGTTVMPTSISVTSNACRDLTFDVPYTESDSLRYGDTLYFQDKLTSKMFMGLKDYAFMTRGVHNFLNGPSWWKIAKFTGTSTAIAVSRDGDNCFIGTSNGKLIRVSKLRLATDSLKGDIDKPLTCLIDTMQINNFGNRAITSIFIDIHDGNKMLVTLGNYGSTNYIYYTTNALDTINPVAFTSKQGNLPANPVYCSLIEMDNSNMVLVGTDLGLYATTDITASSPVWTDESGTVGHVPVFALNQMNNAINSPTEIKYKGYNYDIYNLGSIIMATQGRGAFRSNSFVGINQPHANNSSANSDMLLVFPNPAKDNASVSITLKKSSDVILTVYDLQGKRVAGETFNNRQVGNHKLAINVGGLQSGNYLVVMNAEGTTRSGKLMIVK